MSFDHRGWAGGECDAHVDSKIMSNANFLISSRWLSFSLACSQKLKVSFMRIRETEMSLVYLVFFRLLRKHKSQFCLSLEANVCKCLKKISEKVFSIWVAMRLLQYSYRTSTFARLRLTVHLFVAFSPSNELREKVFIATL